MRSHLCSTIPTAPLLLICHLIQKEDGIFISQDKYVAEILKKFDFANVKTASTPIETQKPLVKDKEASDVDVHLYRSMIGSLMYLTTSRPDIMFAVCACSRVSSFDLESYSDSDYAGANLDRKSTIGALISLFTTITLSTTMAVLDSCPKHNMVAYLEKTEGNAEFHEIIDFLTRNIPSEAQPHTLHVPTQLAHLQDLHIYISSGFINKLRWGILVSDQAKEIQLLKAQIKKFKKQAKPVIKHHRAWLQSVSLKQRLARKSSSKKQRMHQRTSDIPTGRKQIEGTDEQIESTDEKIESTDEQIESTDEHKKKVLLNMSQAKAVSREKEKGVELKDTKETDRPRHTSTRSLLTLKPLLKIDLKDKGKKKIEEEDEILIVESDALIRNFDDIKARIEADRLLAEKLQEQEREQFTIEERAKNFKHSELKTKKFEEIQALYEKIKSEVIKEESKEEAMEEKKKVESTRKRKLGTRKKMKSRKRRYIQNIFDDDSEKENDELRLHLTIAPDEEKEVDIMKLLDRKYQDEIPEGFDRVLWGDLMVMFNPDDENEFWNSQQDWNIVSWKLHGSSGVHTLVTETGLVIHMLVEKKYPLRKEVLMQMLKLKLESEEDSTMALELIRFIKKLLAELEPEDFDGDEEDL
ncbi:hypothetical protein Tco_0259876 [Tanacetum coccineum]